MKISLSRALQAPAAGLVVFAMCLFDLPLPLFYLLLYAVGLPARAGLPPAGQDVPDEASRSTNDRKKGPAEAEAGSETRSQ